MIYEHLRISISGCVQSLRTMLTSVRSLQESLGARHADQDDLNSMEFDVLVATKYLERAARIVERHMKLGERKYD